MVCDVIAVASITTITTIIAITSVATISSAMLILWRNRISCGAHWIHQRFPYTNLCDEWDLAVALFLLAVDLVVFSLWGLFFSHVCVKEKQRQRVASIRPIYWSVLKYNLAFLTFANTQIWLLPACCFFWILSFSLFSHFSPFVWHFHLIYRICICVHSCAIQLSQQHHRNFIFIQKC